MAQGTTTNLDESPLKPTTDVEANPYKRPTVNRRNRRKRSFNEWWSILPFPYKIFIILIAVSVALVIGLYVKKWLSNNPDVSQSELNNTNKRSVPNPEYALPPSRSVLHLFKDGAVCSDAEICSKVGKNILTKGGNVADAALATLFCNGILTMQSMGIGGGFLMNIYIHEEKKAYTLNAKETSPAAAKDELYKSQWDSMKGPLSIATPGEVKGYWQLHKRFGSMPWKELIEPSIELCEEGFILTKHMADVLEPHLLNDTNFKNTFYNNATGKFHRYGEHILPPQQLCNTYKRIAAKGGDDYYTGDLAKDILADLKDVGALVTKEDLESYNITWSDSISVPIHDKNVIVSPPPASGLLVAFILNILKGYNFTADSVSTLDKEALTQHRFVEALKFAFGKRTLLGDPDFVNVDQLVRNLTSPQYAEYIRKQIDDTKTYQSFEHYGAEFSNKTEYGTSHVSVVAPNGDAISVTTSINYYYGAGLIGPRTGILFNSGMDDFAISAYSNYFGQPASTNNYMAARKRAVTSMSPTIITGPDGDVRLVIGSAGGVKIISGISTVALRTLFFKQNIKEAVDAPRLHHQVTPMEIEYEYGNTQALIDKLATFGHKMMRFDNRGAVVCAISKNATGVYANADHRKAGGVDGL